MVKKMIKRYVITAAQNATPVNTAFLDSLLYYCRTHSATLIVIPYFYRNATSPFESEQIDFDSSIEPYLCDKPLQLTTNLVVRCDLKISPTAVEPLTGLEPLTEAKSLIVAHPQISFVCVATPKNELPIQMSSTGSVTLPNYSDSKAGKKGEFHHSFGAVVVETEPSAFHLRHLLANNQGSFIDLGESYSKNNVESVKTQALVMGDLHVGSTCARTTQSTVKLINEVKPNTIVLHDCFDGESVNHHTEANPFEKFKKKFSSLTEELERNASVLKTYSDVCGNLVIVNSNHNDFLYRWLQRTDWRYLDKLTAKLYLQMALSLSTDNNCDVYAKEMRRLGVRALFLKLDESFKLSNIELGQHGHLGANGSRGSIKQFSRTGTKSVVGHFHTPGINKGCYAVGTSTHLNRGYVKGHSSWLNTHCLVYEGGKRQLISIINGKYTFN